MALKKIVAGYFKDKFVDVFNEDGEFSHQENRREWIVQVETDMQPLEEKALLAEWQIHEVSKKMPPALTKDEELDLLIEHGPEHVKQKRAQYKAACDAIKPEIEAANVVFQKAHKAWCDSC